MRLLLVEDDKKLAQHLQRYLSNNKFAVDHIEDGKIAQDKALKIKYDLIILDLTLPSRDGMKVCRTLRDEGLSTPIIILTGRGEIEDKVKGLNAGADDYLSKPFDPSELLARLNAILRRPKQSLPKKLEVRELVLDPFSHTVTREGEVIDLMPKEYALLEYLMRNKNRALTKNELLQHVWGVYSNSSGNRLEVYIRYLREKVDEPYERDLIRTVRGVGYKIEE